MPIHDWTRVDVGLFHAFHQRWISSLCDVLNEGSLPPDYFALAEQRVQGPIPDVLTLHLARSDDDSEDTSACIAVASAPPCARIVQRSEAGAYASKADRITVRHRHGDVVAIIEIVSPGNKGSRAELRAFVEKAALLLRQKVHLLVIDVLPPTKRDPQGMHKALWDEFEDNDFRLPPDKPLCLAAYDAGPPYVAYVEPMAVGEPLPDMPLFVKSEFYVLVPLEASYQSTWNVFPKALKPLLQ